MTYTNTCNLNQVKVGTAVAVNELLYNNGLVDQNITKMSKISTEARKTVFIMTLKK